MSIVESKLDDKTRAMLPELAKPYVERYIRDGDSLPNPELDAARKNAYGEVFMLLASTQEKLAGPDDPQSVAASLPDLIDEIGEIIEGKEQLAAKAKLAIIEAHAGMRSVWQDLAGPEAVSPEVSTISDWLSEIREVLEGKARGLTQFVYEFAHKRFFPEEELPKHETPGELQDALVDRIADERKRLEDLVIEANMGKDEAKALRDGVDEKRVQVEKDWIATASALTAARTAEVAAKKMLAPVLAREKAAVQKEKDLQTRETALELSVATLEKRESRLGTWAKTLKVRLRRRHAWRVSKAMENVANGVLGALLAKKLIQAGADPELVIREEVARLRRAEKVLGEIVGLPLKTVPDSPAHKLLVRAKSLLNKNRMSRALKVAPKKAGDEPETGGKR